MERNLGIIFDKATNWYETAGTKIKITRVKAPTKRVKVKSADKVFESFKYLAKKMTIGSRIKLKSQEKINITITSEKTPKNPQANCKR